MYRSRMAGFSFFREASMVLSGDWVVVGGGEVCTRGGFHLRFFSGAGVKLNEPVGLFFSSSTTPVGFSLNFFTRFFNCHPTTVCRLT